jgi:tetratricopeptide (TPR) repeat protein
MKQVEASDRAKVFDALRRIYPLEGGLGGLQPDVLGETLVSQALEKDDELLDAIFDEDTAREDSRYALTVLTRLGRRVPADERWLKRALERRLNALSEDALYVGIETGEPMPKILAEVVKAAERHERRRAVDLLRPKLPKETRNLANLTVEIRRQSVSFLENKKTGKGAKRDIALTDAFSALALALRNKGQLDEAARSAIEASRHAAWAFRSNTEQDRRRLGAVLIDLSNHLSNVGRFEEALKAAEQTEGLWRDLAAKQPEAYTTDWATSLGNLGNNLRHVGRFEEALKAAEQAEGLWRDLAAKQSEAHTANWASLLGNLGNHLRDVGRFEEALEAAEQSEGLWRDLAAKQPEAYTADWARSLHNLGNNLRDVGRFEEALKAAEQTEGLWRDLAVKQPEAYTADWARSLSNLSEAQLRCEELGTALDTAKAGISRISEFATRYPAVYAPWLGYAHRLSAEAHFRLERINEAAVEARAAVEIWERVVAKRKNFESNQVANAFLILMRCELALDKRDVALSTFRRATDLLRDPLTVNPRPLERTISEMTDLARTIDPKAV